MTPPARPPRLLARLFRLLLPPGDADDIVGDLSEEYVREPPPTIYKPDTTPVYSILIRMRPGSEETAEQLASRILSEVDPSIPPPTVRSLSDYHESTLGPQRATLPVLLAYALFASALSALGIFGVVSYLTARRTHEIGVRLALGARPGGILRLVVGQGLGFALLGAFVALAAAAASGRVIESLLFRTSALDLAVYASATLLVLGTTVVACYVPARRAARVSPTETLRTE